jgi:predicted hydrocarbon binding protein
MVSQHSFSFEADSWLQRNGTAGRKKTMCGMSAGYSWSVFHAARVNFTDILQNSGWCSEVTGMSLVSVELTCRARGDDCCRFLMAPPGQIKFRLKEYLEEMHPSTGDLSEVSLSSFFQASNGCEGEPYSSSERRKWLVKSLTRLLIREGSEDLSQFSQRSGSSSPSGSDSDSDVTTSRLPRPDTPPCFMEGPSCDDHSDEQSYESDSSKESPLASRRGKGLESSNGGQKEGNSSAPSSPGRFTHSRSGSSTSQEFSEALDSDQDLRGARHHARTMSNPPIPISPRHLLGPAVRNDSGGRLRDDDGRVIMNGQRYVFVRAKAFSAEFYTLMRDLFGPGKESEADEYAANFLYDFGRSIGRVDYSRINTRDHIGARLTAFQFMMEDTGWGKIAITEMQYNAAQPDVFSLSFTASHSFEAVCWRKKERKSPMCIITCGYVAGFCGRCLGSDLVCAEIACAAMGDKNCKFIVSRAHSIEKFAKIYLAQNFSDSHEQSARFSNITVLSLTCPWPIAGRGDLDVALASKERPGTPSEERSKFTDSDEFLIGTRRSGTSSWMSSMFKKPAALKVRKRGKKRGGKAERSNQPEVIVALPEFVEVPRELANKLRNDIPREVPLVTLIDRSYPAIAGPNAEESEQFLNNEQGISCVSAQTISTYPRVLSLGIRQGDPICDAFSVLPFENGYVACVCDGCGWGPAPANAARVANSTVTESIRQFCTKTERLTVGDVVDHLLELIARAHNKIIEGKDDIFDSGTTAMLAGLACRVDDSQIEGCALPPAARSVAMPLISSSNWGREMAIHESGESSLVSSAETKLNPRTVRRANGPNVPNSEDKGKRWAWIGISVGDLKVFRWSSRTGRVYDISISSRTNPHDLTDCGGRLGPTLRNGHPDLANLGLAYVPCYENDVIWMVTDGVYDNLDPENDGRMPSEVGHWATDWQQLSEEETALLKRDAYISWFQQRVFNATKSADAPAASNGTAANGTSTASTGPAHTPLIPTTLPSLRDLTAKAVTYCRDLTAKSREFMEQNPGLPLPRDYKEYPGKLDHTTILSFRLSPPGASSSTTK